MTTVIVYNLRTGDVAPPVTVHDATDRAGLVPAALDALGVTGDEDDAEFRLLRPRVGRHAR